MIINFTSNLKKAGIFSCKIILHYLRLFYMKLLVLFLISTFFLNGYPSSTNLISWNAGYRLTWDDFQGPVDPHRKIGVESATQVMIELNSRSEGNRVFFDVSCYFERERSWTASRHSSHLLAHEQLHFDIAELFARKMRQQLKQLTDLNHRNLERKVMNVYRAVNRDHNVFQDLYDKETDHSKNREKQAEWNVRVETLLRETEAHAAPSFSVRMK